MEIKKCLYCGKILKSHNKKYCDKECSGHYKYVQWKKVILELSKTPEARFKATANFHIKKLRQKILGINQQQNRLRQKIERMELQKTNILNIIMDLECKSSEIPIRLVRDKLKKKYLRL